LRHSPFTFTKSLNKSTQKSAFPEKLWASWTASSMILSTGLLLNQASLLDSIRDAPWALVKSKLPSSFCSLEN
jgi:hypothetical protein